MDVEYKLSQKRLKRNVLEAELDTEELWQNDEYHRLERQIDELRASLEDGTERTTDE
jgi:hypothetical protein